MSRESVENIDWIKANPEVPFSWAKMVYLNEYERVQRDHESIIEILNQASIDAELQACFLDTSLCEEYLDTNQRSLVEKALRVIQVYYLMKKPDSLMVDDLIPRLIDKITYPHGENGFLALSILGESTLTIEQRIEILEQMVACVKSRELPALEANLLYVFCNQTFSPVQIDIHPFTGNPARDLVELCAHNADAVPRDELIDFLEWHIEESRRVYG